MGIMDVTLSVSSLPLEIAIEIVSFPMNGMVWHGDVPLFFECLLEGRCPEMLSQLIKLLKICGEVRSAHGCCE